MEVGLSLKLVLVLGGALGQISDPLCELQDLVHQICDELLTLRESLGNVLRRAVLLARLGRREDIELLEEPWSLCGAGARRGPGLTRSPGP